MGYLDNEYPEDENKPSETGANEMKKFFVEDVSADNAAVVPDVPAKQEPVPTGPCDSCPVETPVEVTLEPIEATLEPAPVAEQIPPPPPVPPRKPVKARGGFGKTLTSYLLVGMVGAIIGGFLVLGIAPQVLATRAGLTLGYAPRVLSSSNSGQPVATPLVWDSDPWQIVAEVAEKVSPAVVGVVNQQGGVYDFLGREYTTESSGSGVIITSDGYIVTNYHVVEGQKGLTVYLADGRELPATVVGTDSRADLAVIKIDATGLPTATFGNSDQLRVGELAVAIGNPLGLDFSRTVTSGVVSGLNRVVDISSEASVRLIQTDAVINPGNSGGPLVNAKGEVIGINSMKLVTSQVEGMGFAIPSSMVTRVANEIMATGTVRRALLGVNLADAAILTEDPRVTEKPVVSKGAYIAGVTDTPAQNAGLKVGDVIVEMDGVQVNTVSTLRALLAERAPGDVVTLKVRRGSQELTIEATLGQFK